MSHFDPGQRDEIRTALLAYATKHGIGVPALADRIRDANPRQPVIPISTLQRFLARKRRTSDATVRYYSVFVRQHPADDPDGDLGRALVAFYGVKKAPAFAGVFIDPDYVFEPTRFTMDADERFARITVKSDPGYGFQLSKGVAVDTGGFAFAILKDMLTNLPLSYVFAVAKDKLIGNCIGPNFADKDPKGFLKTIELLREAQDGI